MRDENLKKTTKVFTNANSKLFHFHLYIHFLVLSDFFFLVKLSWPKTLVKKWFNIKSKSEDFQADDVICQGGFFLTILM